MDGNNPDDPGRWMNRRRKTCSLTNINRRAPRQPATNWSWNAQLGRWILRPDIHWGRQGRRSRRIRRVTQWRGPHPGAENLQNPPNDGADVIPENNINQDAGAVILEHNQDIGPVIPEDNQLASLPSLGPPALPVVSEIDWGNQLVAPEHIDPETILGSSSNLLDVNIPHSNWEPTIAPRPVHYQARPVHEPRLPAQLDVRPHFPAQFGANPAGVQPHYPAQFGANLVGVRPHYPAQFGANSAGVRPHYPAQFGANLVGVRPHYSAQFGAHNADEVPPHNADEVPLPPDEGPPTQPQ